MSTFLNLCSECWTTHEVFDQCPARDDCVRCNRLQEELEEQARLNGMGAQREARLMTRVDALIEFVNLVASSHHYKEGEYGFQFEEMAREVMKQVGR